MFQFDHFDVIRRRFITVFSSIHDVYECVFLHSSNMFPPISNKKIQSIDSGINSIRFATHILSAIVQSSIQCIANNETRKRKKTLTANKHTDSRRKKIKSKTKTIRPYLVVTGYVCFSFGHSHTSTYSLFVSLVSSHYCCCNDCGCCRLAV